MLSIRHLALAIAMSGLMQSSIWAQGSGSVLTVAQPPGESGAPQSLGQADRPNATGRANEASSKATGAVRTRRLAENSKEESLLGSDPENRLILPFVRHLASDQQAFWTAPVHFRAKDLEW